MKSNAKSHFSKRGREQSRKDATTARITRALVAAPEPQEARILNIAAEITTQIFEEIVADTKVVISGYRKADGRGTFIVAWTAYPDFLLTCKKIYQISQQILAKNLELRLVDYYIPVLGNPLLRWRPHHYDTNDTTHILPRALSTLTQRAYFSQLQTLYLGPHMARKLSFDLADVFPSLKLVVLQTHQLIRIIWLNANGKDSRIPPDHVRSYVASMDSDGGAVTIAQRRAIMRKGGTRDGPFPGIGGGRPTRFDILWLPSKDENEMAGMEGLKQMRYFKEKRKRKIGGKRAREATVNEVVEDRFGRQRGGCVVM